MDFDPCCGYMGLTSAGYLVNIFPLVSLVFAMSRLFSEPFSGTVTELVLVMLFLSLSSIVYVATVCGIYTAKRNLVRIGLYWIVVQMVILIVGPLVTYFTTGRDEFGNGQAIIIVEVMLGYFLVVMLCLQRQMFQHESYQSLTGYDPDNLPNSQDPLNSQSSAPNMRVRGVEVLTKDGRYRAFEVTNVPQDAQP